MTNSRRLALFFGLLSLMLCLSGWALDLNDLVVKCIYCRNQRTIIGLLGILLLLPIYPYLTRYLSLVLGFYGASVATQQIMLIMDHRNFQSLHFPLSIGSLLFIIGQVCYIFYLSEKKPVNSKGLK